MTVTSAIFNGIQIPRDSLKILLVKTFALTMPLIFVGSLWGYTGVLIGLAAGNIAGGIYAARVMRKSLVEAGSSLTGRGPLQDYRADLEAVFEAISPPTRGVIQPAAPCARASSLSRFSLRASSIRWEFSSSRIRSQLRKAAMVTLSRRW